MVKYGVNKAGFTRKPYEVIEAEIKAKAKSNELFGENIDLSVYSPVGLFVKMLAWNNHLIWQELEKSYYSNWLDSAEGVNLDRVVKWGGISRREAQPAVIKKMRFYGTLGTEIPVNTEVNTGDEIKVDNKSIAFNTLLPTAIDKTQEKINSETGVTTTLHYAETECVATIPGEAGMVPVKTKFVLTNNIIGVELVENHSAAENGTNDQTDAELRAAYKLSGNEMVGSSIDAIRYAVMQVEGVLNAVVYENDTLLPDSEGRPPKSVECIVQGVNTGNKDKIARAIYKSKPAGIESYGIIEQKVIESANTYSIFFNEYETVEVSVDITLDKYMSWDTTTTENNHAQIIENTIKYIGGTILDENGVPSPQMGEIVNGEIYPWRVAAANRDIEGLNNLKVTLSIPTAATQEIIIPGTNTSDKASGLKKGLYSLDVTVGTITKSISIDLTVNNLAWGEVLLIINRALCASDLAVKVKLQNNNILFSTIQKEAGLIMALTDAATAGFIAAIQGATLGTAVAGITRTIPDPSIPAEDKLQLEVAVLPLTKKELITIS